MPEEPKDEPTQHTPKGAEIPVPTKEQVLRDLEKVAEPLRERRNGDAQAKKPQQRGDQRKD
jgi:hypothetical protein